MPTSSQPLSRRQLLRSAGFKISLPSFASLVDLPCLCAAESNVAPTSQETHSDPKRFCCIFFPNGVSLPPKKHPAHEEWHWFPHSFGKNYQLTKPLESLADLRDEFTILSGLSHPAMRSSIAHITADTFLTGADSSQHYRNSISIDQLIAHRIGIQTRFPSLTLSSDGGIGTPGRTQTLSFSPSGRPIPSLSNPRAIFNRLFGVTGRSKQEQRRAFGRDRSILDNVLSETSTIKRNLSPDDRRRLEEYTTSVREIEHRLSRADQWLDVQSPKISSEDLNLAATAAGDAEEYIRAVFDLMYVAILTDSTRSITYQITSEDAKGVGDRFPTSIGLKGHHSLSHDTSKKNGFENWSRYDQFLANQFSYFINRLHVTDDPFQAGSLLDNSIVLYGSSTSKTHLAKNYPLILAGGTSLGFHHGQHRQFDENKHRMSDLYVTVLQQLGLDFENFADSTGALSELLASA